MYSGIPTGNLHHGRRLESLPIGRPRKPRSKKVYLNIHCFPVGFLLGGLGLGKALADQMTPTDRHSSEHEPLNNKMSMSVIEAENSQSPAI